MWLDVPFFPCHFSSSDDASLNIFMILSHQTPIVKLPFFRLGLSVNAHFHSFPSIPLLLKRYLKILITSGSPESLILNHLPMVHVIFLSSKAASKNLCHMALQQLPCLRTFPYWPATSAHSMMKSQIIFVISRTLLHPPTFRVLSIHPVSPLNLCRTISSQTVSPIHEVYVPSLLSLHVSCELDHSENLCHISSNIFNPDKRGYWG